MGQLQVVAMDDLKGLGATEGPPVAYAWQPANFLPHLIPWLAVLALLMLKVNRTASAWWIWLPLGVISALPTGLRAAPELLPSEVLGGLLSTFISLAFGLAAVWLLAPYLQNRLRVVVFLKALLTAGATGVGVYLVQSDGDEIPLVVVFLVFFVVFVVIALGALFLAGWLCRRRYQPLRLSLWLLLLTLALWTLLATPFFLMALLSGAGGDGVEFFQAVAAFGALTFVPVQVFLCLAFANRFYRTRLQQLLGLEGERLPPVISPLAAPTPVS